MLIDWPSFIFGYVTAIATGAVLAVVTISIIYIRTSLYRAHPLFNREDSS